MIELIDVGKYYMTDFGRHYLFRDVSLQLPLDKSVAVIGPNGAGKSTFLRLLGGADVPSEGRIIKTGRISPPMGLTPGLQSSLTGVENARFAGRIHGMSREKILDLIDHVRELSDIGQFFDMPVAAYSAGMKQRVAFAINMAMEYDYYLFDEIGAGGDKEFRKTAKKLVQERLKSSNFIIVSHRTDELIDICDAGIVIQDGMLTYFDDILDALRAYSTDEEDEGLFKRRRKDVPEGAGKSAEPDESNSKPRRSRIRKRRVAAEGAGTSTHGNMQASPAAEDENVALKPKRRRKRKARERQAKAGEVVAGPAGGQPAVTLSASPESGMPAKTRRKSARRKAARTRKSSKEQVSAALDVSTDMTDAENRKLARLARREQRKQQRRQASPEGESTPLEDAGSSRGGRQRPAREQRRQRRETRKARMAAEDPAAPPPSPGQTAAPDKTTLAQTAAHQEKARIKAARAMRLLLQHLDGGSSGSASPGPGRTVLISAAQQSAAEESAAARRCLHKPARARRPKAVAAPPPAGDAPSSSGAAGTLPIVDNRPGHRFA